MLPVLPTNENVAQTQEGTTEYAWCRWASLCVFLPYAAEDMQNRRRPAPCALLPVLKPSHTRQYRVVRYVGWR
jgi:hypothetical protein